MSATSIQPVTNAAEREEFVTFPWRVYADDPYWVPPLLSEIRKAVDPAQNPFFEHAKAEFFLARRNGDVVGTIAAFSNYLYNETHNDNSGFFGFFEVLDEPETAAQLLSAAEDWARGEGHDVILGPMQYSTNDELGLLVEGFNDSPRILMTYNPGRYPGYFDAAGYEKAMDLWAYAQEAEEMYQAVPEKVYRVRERILERYDVSVRQVDMSNFDAEVERLVEIYNAGWADNWGAVPMTAQEAAVIADSLKPILDPDLTIFVEKDEKTVALGIALPDLNHPLRLAYPKPGTPEVLTMLKLLWHWKVRRDVPWVRGWGVGIHPDYQGLGLDALIMAYLIETIHNKGYKNVEMGWVLETNERIQRDGLLIGAEVYKTYRIYQKAL